MLYDYRSSEGRRTFMGRLVYNGQPWDSRRQVMRKKTSPGSQQHRQTLFDVATEAQLLLTHLTLARIDWNA